MPALGESFDGPSPNGAGNDAEGPIGLFSGGGRPKQQLNPMPWEVLGRPPGIFDSRPGLQSLLFAAANAGRPMGARGASGFPALGGPSAVREFVSANPVEHRRTFLDGLLLGGPPT